MKYSHTRPTLTNNYPFSPSKVRGKPWERSFEARRAPWEDRRVHTAVKGCYKIQPYAANTNKQLPF